MRLLLIVLAAAVGPAGAIPKMIINLDLPPRMRWKEVMDFYREDFVAMMAAWQTELGVAMGLGGALTALKYLDSTPEQYEEILGAVEAVNDPLVTYPLVKTWNSMYELNHPTFCTAMLVARADGTVIHGRNMDYVFTWLQDGKTKDLSKVTYEAEFQRWGKPVFMAVQWPGHIGVHTGMRFGAWSMNVNMRPNSYHDNLEALKDGAKTHSFQVRGILDSAKSFDEAVKAVYELKLAAPLYCIVAGNHPYEGAVMTLDRSGIHKASTAPLVRLSPVMWHVAQTNDDINMVPSDLRRPVIDFLLSLNSQTQVSNNMVLQQMRFPPNFNTATVFTSFFNPATGETATYLPEQKAEFAPGVDVQQKGISRFRGWQRFLAPAPTFPPHMGPPTAVDADVAAMLANATGT